MVFMVTILLCMSVRTKNNDIIQKYYTFYGPERIVRTDRLGRAAFSPSINKMALEA